MRLDAALADVTRLGFDTPPIIYFVEANPQYDALVTAVFQHVEDGRLEGITSSISLCEVLTVPIRQGDAHLQQEYRDLLLHSDHFVTMPISMEIAEQAAELRARYGLRTPDAVQVAAALNAGCEALLTNDIGLLRVTELRVLVLDDLTV